MGHEVRKDESRMLLGSCFRYRIFIYHHDGATPRALGFRLPKTFLLTQRQRATKGRPER